MWLVSGNDEDEQGNEPVYWCNWDSFLPDPLNPPDVYIYTYMGIVYKHIEFQVNFHETAGFNVSQKETKGASKETNSHKRHHRPPVETHFISPRYSEVFMIYALSLMQGHQEAPRHATPRGAKDELIIWRREMAMR